jgi:intein-encoded DNA endonuclease-like protein
MQTFRECDSRIRKEIFVRFKSLRDDGLGYKRIRRAIRHEYAVHIPNSTFSYWCNNDVVLFGGKNKFEPFSTPELAYVLGVCFGDGSIGQHAPKQDYTIRLTAADKDFVETFSAKLSVILQKTKPFYVVKNKEGHYATSARSKEMYFFIKELKADFEKVKPFAEAYPADFIRGLADSEGGAYVALGRGLAFKIAIAYSANRQLLGFCKTLLEKNFNILCEIKTVKFAGQSDSIIDGRTITRTKDLFCLRPLRVVYDWAFAQKIGFTLCRKKQRCEDYLFLAINVSANKRVRYWRQLYSKNGRRWTRNNQKPIDEINFVD